MRSGLIAWIALPPLAFLNAALRELIWQPVFGQSASEWLSAIIMVCLSVGVATVVIRRQTESVDGAVLWGLGAAWAGLTILFEAAFFGLVMGVSSEELLSAYDVRGGSLWSLVVIGVFAAPRIAGRLSEGPGN